MENLVFIVAIGMECSKYSRLTWEWYADKYDCDFKVIKESSDKNMAPHWERYTVMERYPDYDNYIYVDADAMVSWRAPDLFKDLEGRGIYAVKDLGSLEWIIHSIEGYQHFFPDVTINWWDYLATGFLKFDSSQRKLFQKFIDFHKENEEEINDLQYRTLRKGFDQTPFNYFCAHYAVAVQELPPVYSLSHLKKKDIFFNGMFTRAGHVWQFNDVDYDSREEVMKGIWKQIKNNYKK